jgi:hypothetical protein
LAKLLEDCLPATDRKNARDLASIMLMAFDGYALNFHLKGGVVCPPRHLALFADILDRAAARARAFAHRQGGGAPDQSGRRSGTEQGSCGMIPDAVENLPRVFPTVVHMLADTAARFPGQTALICGPRSLGYAQYLRCVAGFAEELAGYGARRPRCSGVRELARCPDRDVRRSCGRGAGGADQPDLYGARTRLHS